MSHQLSRLQRQRHPGGRPARPRAAQRRPVCRPGETEAGGPRRLPTGTTQGRWEERGVEGGQRRVGTVKGALRLELTDFGNFLSKTVYVIFSS